MATPVIPPAVERRYVPKLSLKRLSLTALSPLFQTIIDASTALDAAVPAGAQPWAPNPDTATMQTAKDNFDAALLEWNPEGPRGSAESRNALRQRRLEAEQIFQKYVEYVSSWSRYNGELIIAAGLALKTDRSPSGAVGVVTDLKQVFVQRTVNGSVNVASPFVGLHFKKAPNAKAYNIYRILGDGRTLVMSTTKARFNKVNVGATPGTQVVLRVEALGSLGSGSLSEPFTLTAI